MATRQKAEATTEKPTFSLISNEKLIQLYSTMLECRMLEERVRELLQKGRITGAYDVMAGQEASVVGSAIDLKPGDTIASSRRDFIASFVKGATLESIFGQHFKSAKTSSSVVPTPLDAVIAAAEKHKAKNKGGVAIAFASDSSTPLPAWQQALKTAGAQGLPILFVDRKQTYQNQTSQTSAKKRPKPEDLDERPFGFPRIVVDSHDVVAVYRVAHESVSRARKGRGPALIECVPFEESLRLKIDSVGNGGDAKRKQKSAPDQNPYDPIANMEAYLTSKGLFAQKMKHEIVGKFNKDLEAAVRSTTSPPRAKKTNAQRGVRTAEARKSRARKVLHARPRKALPKSKM